MHFFHNVLREMLGMGISMKERLQKVMAEYGVASRRKCEQIILDCRVKVNGSIISELGLKVDKTIDKIEVDGVILKPQNNRVYVMLNKPVGYITSAKDQFNRPTVIDLVSDIRERIFPVGRLDYDTEGLLILTNDGELTFKITHPRHNINKTYHALVKGYIDKNDVSQFKAGMLIDGYKTAPAELQLLKNIGDNSLVNITIHEGRNRQVRKMCQQVGHSVIKLKRISIGDIKLGDLKAGQWRPLTKSEVDYLYKLGE